MEMQIASSVMAMAMQNILNGSAVGMLKETMEATEEFMESFNEMIEKIPSPDGRGQLLDIRV